MTRAHRPSRRERRVVVSELRQGPLRLGDEDSHYLRRVLRMKPGDVVVLVDGRGSRAVARLVSFGGRVAELDVGAPEPQRGSPSRLTVALAQPKGARADWAVEKLTELGVAHIAWLACERSAPLTNQGGERAQRFRRIAEAAAAQSGRADVPTISGPLSWRESLATKADLRLVAVPGARPLEASVWAQSYRDVVLAVGPEGGFTATELAEATQAGYIAIGLGASILRIETAAVCGAAVLLAKIAIMEPA